MLMSAMHSPLPLLASTTTTTTTATTRTTTTTTTIHVSVVMFLVLLSSAWLTMHGGHAFEWHNNNNVGNRPQPVDRRAMVGLWRLSPRMVETPMKEFTVYPKASSSNRRNKKKNPWGTGSAFGRSDETKEDDDNNEQDDDDDAELLFMLKEDGSFQQFADDDTTLMDEDDSSSSSSSDEGGSGSIDMDASWRRFHRRRVLQASEQFPLKGIWDYLDGKLILAADRPEQHQLPRPANINNYDDQEDQEQQPEQQRQQQDTLLVGRVIALHKIRLMYNPRQLQQEADLSNNNGTIATMPASMPGPAIALEAHLAVPRGRVKVGRFFYPKKHPSFFDLPMFKSTQTASFSLTQVLGGLNSPRFSDDDDDDNGRTAIQKFQVKDFYNKSFLLTSHPIGFRAGSSSSSASNRFGSSRTHQPNDDTYSSRKKADDADNLPVNIRVMQLLFHTNNTFSTVAGLGESILRGKFDVIGQNMDQLWMKVSRFGFGRSVSGSVYSEGRMLTNEDDKGYWGTIDYEQNDAGTVQYTDKRTPENPVVDDKVRRLEVKGCVLFGSGLEPMPVGRFIMREARSDDDMAKGDDDEDSDLSEEESNIVEGFSVTELGEEGIRLSGEENAFQ